ncbi:MAG: TonB-dependent receptor [Sphingomonas sp.]|nr:TonB-dependent receptor [Sphingomonas sp.]
MKLSYLKFTVGTAALAIAAAGSTGHAQNAAGESSADAELAIPEIIVTAQKREQSIKDVPISIQVVSGEALREKDLNDLQNVTQTLPAVTVADNGVSQYLFIRGIGSGENAGFEQSVGTFIDGIYVGRGRISRQQQLDLDRVEVLRGPQSIFFGNSSIAGAFNVATAGPGNTWEGYINGQYEFEFEGKEIEAAVGGPLTDTLGIRLAGRYAKTDGWVTNIIDDSTSPSSESYAFRATVAWSPTETVDVTYKGSYAKNKSYGTPYEALKCPPLAAAPGPACALALTDPAGNTIPLDFRKVSGNQPVTPIFPGNAPTPTFADENFKQESQLHVLNVDWDVGAGVITSTTGYLYTDEPDVYDPDQTRYFIINVENLEKFKQFSQELRFVSDDSGPLQYIIGAYYQHSELDRDGHARFNLAAGGLPVQTDTRRITYDEADLYAVFGQLTYNLTDALSVSVGGRYQHIDKKYTTTVGQENLANTGPADPFSAAVIANIQSLILGTRSATLTNKKFTPEFIVNYDVTPDVRVYAKYTEGFKAGGFDGANVGDITFKPETVDSYEIGLKMSSFDNRLQLNVAAFRSEYKDLQVSIFDPTTTTNRVQNAGASLTQGIEVEATLQATPEFRINAAFAYLDAKSKSFPGAPCYYEQQVGLDPGCAPITPGSTALVQDLTGRELQFSPDFSGTLAFNYEVPVADSFKLNGNWEINYSDAYFTTLDNDPDFQVPHGVQMSARIAFGDIDDRWSVGVLGKNLTNKDDFTGGINWPLATGSKLVTRERPRTIAVFANYNF